MRINSDMAYRPPNKSAYGDKDFSDDTWSEPNQQPTTYSQPPSIDTIGQTPQQSQSQALDSNYSPQQQQNQQGFKGVAQNIAATITQEDLLFMQSWRRDSFYQRG